MEVYKIENLSFSYPTRGSKALDSVSLSVKQGEFVTLCGKSGCGKTTLLRLLKPIIAPFGGTDGSIHFCGKSLTELSQREQTEKIGFVMQNPDNQLVTDKVWHEIAFGLESLGFSNSEIRRRVAEMASFFGIESWFHKKVNELSGGQKQLLNLASVMVMQPSVLILDEPTSQLDPIAASEFLKMLEKINRETGTAIILSEHHLEDAFPISDRIIIMDNGKIIAEGDAKNVCRALTDCQHDMQAALPTPMRVYGAVENDFDCPVTVREGREWLEKYTAEHTLSPDKIPADKVSEYTKTAVELKNVWFRYEKNLPDVIKGLNLAINKGEIHAILGGNGVGKTTALSLMSGLNKPYRGEVYIGGEKIGKVRDLYGSVLGVLPQNPQCLFVKNTVYLDLMEMLSQKQLSKDEIDKKIKEVSALCRIDGLLQSHPYDLSGGEQQRMALAKILLKNPQILLLDEPTKGLDAHFKAEMADILNKLKQNGVTVIMVSHDVEFCAEYADRCTMIFDGSGACTATAREFFLNNSFYTTVASRMARGLIPKALLADDIILALGGEKKEKNKELPSAKSDCTQKEPQKNVKLSKKDTKATKRTLFTGFLTLAAVILTVFIGSYFFGDRRYYIVSMLIILETLIPFALLFERRKPQAREVVLISTLCAIIVAGRGAFAMLPQFKPVVALVIISGACLGGEAGFLIGAVSAFVSNFFFGQGPWTVWQMLSFGVIGFLSGIVLRNSRMKKSKMALCVFGFLMTLLIYGGIMNPASVNMYQNVITKDMLIASYAAGLPFDLIHAIATVFFLWLAAIPMTEKIERIKIKYGLIQ